MYNDVMIPSCGQACIAFPRESARVSIARAGGLRIVLTAMAAHSRHRVLQRLACTALGNLCFGSERNLRTVVSTNAMHNVVTALRIHLAAPDVQV